MCEIRERAIAAAVEYQARNERLAHPQGHYDSAGRWFPSESEMRPCCDSIRQPSRRWPWSYMLHCRTKKHLAQLFDVTVADLNRALMDREV